MISRRYFDLEILVHPSYKSVGMETTRLAFQYRHYETCDSFTCKPDHLCCGCVAKTCDIAEAGLTLAEIGRSVPRSPINRSGFGCVISG